MLGDGRTKSQAFRRRLYNGTQTSAGSNLIIHVRPGLGDDQDAAGQPLLSICCCSGDQRAPEDKVRPSDSLVTCDEHQPDWTSIRGDTCNFDSSHLCMLPCDQESLPEGVLSVPGHRSTTTSIHLLLQRVTEC